MLKAVVVLPGPKSGFHKFRDTRSSSTLAGLLLVGQGALELCPGPTGSLGRSWGGWGHSQRAPRVGAASPPLTDTGEGFSSPSCQLTAGFRGPAQPGGSLRALTSPGLEQGLEHKSAHEWSKQVAVRRRQKMEVKSCPQKRALTYPKGRQAEGQGQSGHSMSQEEQVGTVRTTRTRPSASRHLL